jgi:hypothetical protein
VDITYADLSNLSLVELLSLQVEDPVLREALLCYLESWTLVQSVRIAYSMARNLDDAEMAEMVHIVQAGGLELDGREIH